VGVFPGFRFVFIIFAVVYLALTNQHIPTFPKEKEDIPGIYTLRLQDESVAAPGGWRRCLKVGPSSFDVNLPTQALTDTTMVENP